MEQLQNEISALDVRIKKIKRQIDLPTTERDIKLQMTEFLSVTIQSYVTLLGIINFL